MPAATATQSPESGPFLDQAAEREHKSRNMMHSLLLIGGIGAILTTATWILWGPLGALLSVGVLGVLAMLSPRIPAETVMRLYGARHVPRDESQLSSLVDVLAYRAGLAVRPELYAIPSTTLNAFTAGTSERPAIAVTEGLLRRLTLREVAGVIAHEMSHIRNNDLEVMGLADLVTRFLQIISYVALGLAVFNLIVGPTSPDAVSWWAILLLYLAPALSNLMQLGLSRVREFDADLEAAAVTGDPLGLASALRRVESYTGHVWEDLMYPVPQRRIPQPSLLRSHPHTKDRIARLLELKDQPVMEPLVIVEQPMVSMVGYGPIAMRPRYRWPGVWY